MTSAEKIDLIKWILSSFVLVIITTILTYKLDDRRQGIQEIEKYDKYATQLIIENNSLAKRRLVAQYFAYVTPSNKLRSCWMNYYKLLDKQYKQLLKRDSSIVKEIESNKMLESFELNNQSNLKSLIDEHERNLIKLDDTLIDIKSKPML